MKAHRYDKWNASAVISGKVPTSAKMRHGRVSGLAQMPPKASVSSAAPQYPVSSPCVHLNFRSQAEYQADCFAKPLGQKP